MSLATSRAVELLGRNAEKIPVHKHLSYPHNYAQPSVAAADAGSCDDSHQKDVNPHARAVLSCTETAETEHQNSESLPVIAEAEPEFFAPPARAPEAGRSMCPSPAFNLDVCPSFSEQRPQGTKPLFIERHNTLQRVHENTLTDGALVAPRMLDTGHPIGPAGGAPYLPSWEISRSQLWMMTAASIGKIDTLPPTGSATTTTTTTTTTTLTTAQGSAIGLDRSSSVRDASTATSTPFACRFTQASVTQQVPGLSGLFRGKSMIHRECPATPHGMGPLPTLLTPSFTMASLAARPGGGKSSRDGVVGELPSLEPEWECFAAVPELPVEGTTGGSEKGEDEDPLHHHHRQKDDVAFVAGIAAATSTATVVSHAASSAMTGLAGLLSQMSMSGSTMLKHLGYNLLNVGSSLMVSRLQSMIMNTSTMKAAEAVLGAEAPEVSREQLRQRLRYTLAGASVMWFLLNLHQTTDVLTHLDFEHDFVTSTKVVLNLATSGPGLIKNCQELLQVSFAVTLGVGKRVMGADEM
ncbi:hypothetical protein VaNZ11_015560 [Volvox africanus]|uniref:GPI-anchored surface protein n=1 Tax=Volvox africanus TaxID=51714 RepID=A0ABQ5SNC5_9CHLO|nr:hypothetical protein VaNZ11_015560 [Volvox africanus]